MRVSQVIFERLWESSYKTECEVFNRKRVFMFDRNKGNRRKVKYFFQALPPIKTVKGLREADDLPRISLHGALERFVLGAYEDCVFHSTFSVEIALLLRLDKKLSPDEKESIRQEAIRNKTGLMFGKIISRAREKSILNDDNVEKAWALNNLRNMYAHPANWVAFVKQQYRMSTLNIEEEMPEIYTMVKERLTSMSLPLKKDVIMKILEPAQKKTSEYLKRLEKIPDLDWCASQDTLGFQSKKIKDYYKEILRDVLSAKGLMDLIKHVSSIVTYAQNKYPYNERNAHKALVYAYEILRDLEVI